MDGSTNFNHAMWFKERARTLGEAIEYALGKEKSPPVAASNAAPSSTLFSERETWVLALVAEGFRNPQVAQKLYLSPCTVD